MPIRALTLAQRLTAYRLALYLTAGLFSSTSFTWEHMPIRGDAYSQLAWLRAQLAPLAVRDRFIRDLVRILDPERPLRPWGTPAGAKRELLRLSACVQALTTVKGKRARRNNAPALLRPRSRTSQ